MDNKVRLDEFHSLMYGIAHGFCSFNPENNVLMIAGDSTKTVFCACSAFDNVEGIVESIAHAMKTDSNLAAIIKNAVFTYDLENSINAMSN